MHLIWLILYIYFMIFILSCTLCTDDHFATNHFSATEDNFLSLLLFKKNRKGRAPMVYLFSW